MPLRQQRGAKKTFSYEGPETIGREKRDKDPGHGARKNATTQGWAKGGAAKVINKLKRGVGENKLLDLLAREK